MENSMLILLISLLCLLFFPSQSNTVLVDGVAKWRNPTIHVGDSVIFKHKHQYDLYIFRNRRAFHLCNFTQAFLLTNPNSPNFTWHASRPGVFYFSFNNGSLNTCPKAEKLAIKVITTPPDKWTLSPQLPPSAAPSPTSGGIVSSSPVQKRPFPSHGETSPSPAPTLPTLPDKGGGIPFINSNPAVPLPTGEVDSTTIRPLPTSDREKQVVGLLAYQIPICCLVWLLF